MSRLRVPMLVVSIAWLAALAGCEEGDGLIFGGSGAGAGTGGTATQLVAVGGDAQTGATLEALPAPLRVAALDFRGDPVAGAPVRWELIRGVGTLSSTLVESDADGEASVLLTPGAVLGELEVEARLEGRTGTGVRFTARATAIRIEIRADRFVGPLGGDTTALVAGDTVEWVNRDVERHSVVTVERPDGGSVIRSGPLLNSERFRFVPNLGGIWVYEDTLAVSVDPVRGALRVAGRQEVGALRIVVESTGAAPDGRFQATVDGGLFAAALKAGESVTFPNLSAIPHEARLREVPPNCRVAGENPRMVAVVSADTVATVFQAVCE